MSWTGRALIVFLGFVAFWPAVGMDFQLDDHQTIVANPAIKDWRWRSLRSDWTADAHGPADYYFRPLQPLLNRIQFTLWGVKPFGYHLTNLLVHIGNALLLFELLMALSFSDLVAWTVAGLFVVHPIIISELMMASGIPELLCFFFSLATLLCWRRGGVWAVAAGFLCYGLALLAKESGIAVPLLWAICTRPEPLSWRRHRWLILGIGVVTLLYLGLRLHALGTTGAFPVSASTGAFFIHRFPRVLLRYAGLAYFPWHLHSYRLMPAITAIWGYLAGMTLIAAYVWKGRPAWARWAAAWGLIALLPKLPLMVTGHYMLEHWLYPALPALLLPIAMGLSRVWAASRAAWRRAGTAALALLLCGCLFSARYHLLVRGSDELNYRWSLHYTRATPLMFNLGLICLQTGRSEEALQYIQPVYALYPDDPVIAKAFRIAQTAVSHSQPTQDPQNSF